MESFSSFSSEVIQVIDLNHSCCLVYHSRTLSGQSIPNITLTINAISRFMKAPDDLWKLIFKFNSKKEKKGT